MCDELSKFKPCFISDRRPIYDFTTLFTPKLIPDLQIQTKLYLASAMVFANTEKRPQILNFSNRSSQG